MTPAEIKQLARTVCTPKEYDALRLSIAGLSIRAIGRDLNVSHTAVRLRLKRARTKIEAALQHANA